MESDGVETIDWNDGLTSINDVTLVRQFCSTPPT